MPALPIRRIISVARHLLRYRSHLVEILLELLAYGRLAARTRWSALQQGLSVPGYREYHSWIRVTETARQRAESATWVGETPTLSVIMPTYNADAGFLQKAVASVRMQSYPKWELCIVDDGSRSSDSRRLIETAAGEDQRIRFLCHEQNRGIAAASNSAVALATGPFLVLMDHDDEISSEALSLVGKTIARQPELTLVYSDEDKLDEHGRRCDPYFKSGWNPELFFGQNLVSHLGAYRAELVKHIGGFRSAYEGSQDYDLALRIADVSGPSQIAHIPEILYHWRLFPESSSFSQTHHAAALDAARRAVQEVLDRRSIGTVETSAVADYFRIRLRPPSPLPSVSLISAGEPAELARMLAATQYPRLEACRARSADASAFNEAARSCASDVLVFLSEPLAPADGGWLLELVSQLCQAGIGVVGPKIIADGRIEAAGLVIGGDCAVTPACRGMPAHSHGYFGQLSLTRRTSAVSAACLATTRDKFNSVDGFDEGAFPKELFDADFCLRLADQGLATVWTPFALLHAVHTRMPRFRGPCEQHTFRERWAGYRDKFHNPNLPYA